MDLRTALSAMEDLALPRVCVVCGRALLTREKHICTLCLADLPETHFALLDHNPMSDSLNEKIERHRIRLGLESTEEYSFGTALFYYKSGTGYERITKALKYSRNFAAGRYFSAMLAARIDSSAIYSGVDCIIPVPLHWTREWKRGYNQAETIARELSRALTCPCLPHALRRCRRTRTQTRLGREAKAANVSGAFALNQRFAKQLTAVHHILLVDDVFTTGATLSECHIALRSALGPAIRISVASLAFVG